MTTPPGGTQCAPGLEEGAFSFKVYGLEQDNGLVRADVFARQMSQLVRALRSADRFVNGAKRHNFLVEELTLGSAVAVLREKRSSRKFARSCTSALGEALSEVYKGDARVSRYPRSLLAAVTGIAAGALTDYSHAEVAYSGGNIVRIDDFFVHQASTVVIAERHAGAEAQERLFAGVSRNAFDGALVVIDRRGEVLRGSLTLTAGGREVDCTIRRDLLSTVLDNFERRLRVTGTAIYDGTSFLPQRLDVEQIQPIAANGDLARWKGRFRTIGGNQALAWNDE